MAELKTGESNDDNELDQATVPDEAVASQKMCESETNSAQYPNSFGQGNIQSIVDDSTGFEPNVSDDGLRRSVKQSSGPGNIQPSDSGIDSESDDISPRVVRDSASVSGNIEADEAYNRFFEEYFPKYEEGVYKVPRVFFGNHPYIVDKEKRREFQSSLKETVPLYHYDRTESDVAGDKAEKIVADSIEKLLKEENHPAFIITSYKFINFCNKKGQLSENDITECAEQGVERKGEHDLLIVHSKYGIIFIQVKSIRGNTCPNTKAKNAVTERVKDAIKQLRKDKSFFKAKFDDLNISDDMLNFTIALPNIEKNDLRCQYQKCETEIKNEYKTNGGLDHCLFKDEMINGDSNMVNIRRWWLNFVKGSTAFKSTDDYKQVIARYIGYKSTVEIPVVHHKISQNQSFPDARKFSDCVSAMGNRYMNIMLTPEQVYILNTTLPRLVIHGQFGTGKTVLLILKVRNLLLNLKKVCVVTMCPSPLEQVLEETIRHDIHPAYVQGLAFEKARSEKDVLMILNKCAEQERHVFIDEFPSYTGKVQDLKQTIKRFPEHLMLWCIMSREREDKLSDVLMDIFEPKSFIDPIVKTSRIIQQEFETSSDDVIPCQPSPHTVCLEGGSSQDQDNAQQGDGEDKCKGLFIHLRLSTILRCPPTVHSVLPNLRSHREIVTFNTGENIQKELATHFHSLGLSTSRTIDLLKNKPESPKFAWKNLVVVSAEIQLPFLAILKSLEIPLISWRDMNYDRDLTDKARYVFQLSTEDSKIFIPVATVTNNLPCSIHVKGGVAKKKIKNDEKEVAQLLFENGFVNGRIEKLLGVKKEQTQTDWSEVIFVEETMSCRELRKLEIPIVTPAEETAVNRVLYTDKNNFKGYSRKEVLYFEDNKAIANPTETVFCEGPDILYIDHTKDNCHERLRLVLNDLDLIDHQETRQTIAGGGHLHPSGPSEQTQSFQQISENMFTQRDKLTKADVVILDARQNPESIAGLFQSCGLPVVDKLNEESVDMAQMFSPFQVMYIKPRMFAGLEKKVVFVVREKKPVLVSHLRPKIIEEPLMLACTRYTSQLVIITTN